MTGGLEQGRWNAARRVPRYTYHQRQRVALSERAAATDGTDTRQPTQANPANWTRTWDPGLPCGPFERTNCANQEGGGVRDLDAAAQAGGSACAGCVCLCAAGRDSAVCTRNRGWRALLGEIDRERRAGTWERRWRAWTLLSGSQLSFRSRQAWLAAAPHTSDGATSSRRRAERAVHMACARVRGGALPCLHPSIPA